MASRKKSTDEIKESVSVSTETPTKTKTKTKTSESVSMPKHKYPIGSVVYISKDALADLNGFSLFPQYKKYTYTVEAYDEKSGVYSLRRANLLINLKETSIINPDERAHDTLNRKQF